MLDLVSAVYICLGTHVTFFDSGITYLIVQNAKSQSPIFFLQHNVLSFIGPHGLRHGGGIEPSGTGTIRQLRQHGAGRGYTHVNTIFNFKN